MQMYKRDSNGIYQIKETHDLQSQGLSFLLQQVDVDCGDSLLLVSTVFCCSDLESWFACRGDTAWCPPPSVSLPGAAGGEIERRSSSSLRENWEDFWRSRHRSKHRHTDSEGLKPRKGANICHSGALSLHWWEFLSGSWCQVFRVLQPLFGQLL